MGTAARSRPGRDRPDSARGVVGPSRGRRRVRALGRGPRGDPADNRAALRVREDVRPGRDPGRGRYAAALAGDRKPDHRPVGRLCGRGRGRDLDRLLRGRGAGRGRGRRDLDPAFTFGRDGGDSRHGRCRSHPDAVALVRPRPVRARGRRLLGPRAQPDHDRRDARADLRGSARRLGVPFGPGLVVLQYLAAAAGCTALVAAAVASTRLPPESRPAAVFCLLASGGVLILAIVSLWRPLLEARYAGVMWLPLFALAGVGLAALPRRAAVALVAALAVPALALSVATTHPETSSLIPELDARAGDHDLVAASTSHYLVLLDEADPRTRSRLHVLTVEDPPWFDGTAAYPPGAVIHAVPADVMENRGRIFWVADPGATPPLLPAGYHSLESRCAIGVGLTIYGPDG